MSSIGGFKRRTPTSQKTRRAVKKYEPKVVENPKRILFLRGARTSSVVTDALTDLFAVTRPHCKKLRKRNAFHPFEAREHLEFLGFKNDCSLFCFGTDSKKRPHNLVIGRHFDFHVLDMAELCIIAADRLDASRVAGADTASLGGRALFVFEGAEFASDPSLARLQNLLVDFFRGAGGESGEEAAVNLDGCDRVLAFSLRSADGESAVDTVDPTDTAGTTGTGARRTVLCMRHYALRKARTAAGMPPPGALGASAELIDIGPNFDFELRRMTFASPAEFKVATRRPKEILAKLRSTEANVSGDAMQNLRGQLHVGTQEVDQLNLRRFKAHRKAPRDRDAAAANGDYDDGEEGRGEGDAEEAPRKRRRHRRAGGDDAEETRPEVDI